jgi:HTH-type transcriptional regulator / antitoxin HigA
MAKRYEYTPDAVTAPGETLLEVLEDRAISQAELSERTGRPKKTINEIVKGKAAITPDTALQLERVLGIPAAFWSSLERNYREHLARLDERARLEDSGAWLRTFPVDEMAKRGWIRRETDPVEKARALLDFFGVASPDQWHQVAESAGARFRRSAAFESDTGSMLAWLRMGTVQAQKLACGPFDKDSFLAVLPEIRLLTASHPAEAFPMAVDLCSRVGVAVVLVRELKGSHVSGATRWMSSEKALIQLSDRYKKDDFFWFAFFHEAAHILKHSKRTIFLEGNRADAEIQEEAEANKFAADFLIPPVEWNRIKRWSRYTKAKVRLFSSHLGIAPGIVVGRLQHEHLLPHSHLNGLKQSVRIIEMPRP